MIRVRAQFKSQGMTTHENSFALGVGRTWFFDIVLCMYDWACFMGWATQCILQTMCITVQGGLHYKGIPYYKGFTKIRPSHYK